MSKFSRRIAATPFARAAALPVRVRDVAKYDANVVGASARWLITSREHTNYSYDLTDRNLRHLAWWVAAVTATPVSQVRTYIAELQNDTALREHITHSTAKSARRGLADREVRYGRRVGWYAITRALRPTTVVETGTDKGLGSCVFATALMRNGNGRLITIDVNPDSGYLVTDRYRDVVERRIGDSVTELEQLKTTIDLFLHDSLHTHDHEMNELRAVQAKLSTRAIVLSDNAHESDALAHWAEQSHRTFSFFAEQPQNHWWPGDGIGAAWDR
jgi:predicted O-methyltransferase YrrM